MSITFDDTASEGEIEILKKDQFHSSIHSVTSEDESPDSLKNPFLDDKVKERYVKLYEDTKYECRSRFDPEFKWTKQRQRKLTWKLDLKVTLFACFLFIALQIDRTNLTQAVSDNFLTDLNMTTDNYNTGNTLFYVCFLIAELPSQLVSKKLGSDIWIPIQMTCWAIVTISQFCLTGKSGFYACRALLGLFEGGFIADLILWLSYFYTDAELSIRLSFFWAACSSANVMNYLVAYGILHMTGVHGNPGWAWLFLIEGFVTLGFGIVAFFLMVPSPVQTAKPWNKQGWFTDDEEKIIVNKILRNDPSKGDMHNRQGLTLKMLYEAVSDWHLWPIYFIGLVAYVPETTIASYMTLLLKDMGFSTFHTNLLCIPYIVLKLILLLCITYFSEYIKNIFTLSLIQPFWVATLMGVLRFWKGTMVNQWGTYIVLTLLLADPYIHAMMVGACSRNSQSVKTRTVSASVYNIFVQLGSLIASNIYRKSDAPLYHRGNSILFGFALGFIPVLLGTNWFYKKLNHRRDKIWDSMTQEEKDHYILHTSDKGSSRLDFRFAY